MREEKLHWRQSVKNRRARFRVDESAIEPEPVNAVVDRDLRGILRACARIAIGDRREEKRLVPAARRGWLGWRSGVGRFSAEAVEIANISRGGALLVLSQRPPRDQPVWLCLGDPHPTEGLRAAVVEVAEASAGSYRIRLAFRDFCPDPFFLSILYGPLPVPGEADPPEDESENDDLSER
jgi:hypothetical protein